jgi:hypothetical protein
MDGISRQCPVECLVSLLSRPTLDALISGLEDATVGQVIELHERGLLGRNYNIGSGRIGEIRRCLAAAKLIEPGKIPYLGRGGRAGPVEPDHHSSCARTSLTVAGSHGQPTRETS